MLGLNLASISVEGENVINTTASTKRKIIFEVNNNASSSFLLKKYVFMQVYLIILDHINKIVILIFLHVLM